MQILGIVIFKAVTKIRAGNILKSFLIALLLFQSHRSVGQVDLQHALPDLMKHYSASAQYPSKKIALALAISNFYLNNKARSKSVSDSVMAYAELGRSLATTMNDRKGIEDAQVMKARLLLQDERFSDYDLMTRTAQGTLLLRLQLLLGKYYLQKGGEEKIDLDLADSLFQSSKSYADQHHMPVLSLLSRIYHYTVLLEREDDSLHVNQEFEKIIAICKVFGNKRLAVMTWHLRAVYSGGEVRGVRYLSTALQLAIDAKDTEMAAGCLKEIADANLHLGKLDLAEQQLQTVLKMYRGAGYKNLQFTYDLLSAVYSAKGNFEIAVGYSLKAVTAAQQTATDIGLSYLQYRLGDLCNKLGQRQESIDWYQKSIETYIRIFRNFPYLAFRQLSAGLIADGKAKIVLKKLETLVRDYPPEKEKSIFIDMLKADCYAALNQPKLAEQFYLKAINGFDVWKVFDNYYYLGYKSIALFYIRQGKYDQADAYLEKILATRKDKVPATDLAEANQLKFKVDSAKGNYLSAIRHFEIAKAITDSVFNEVRLKQTEQLQLQFKTAQRDQENLVLRNKNTLQRSELEKEELKSKLITTGLAGSLLLIALMVYLYLAKQKANNNLTWKQNEINRQNQQLNQLVQDKEWLIKEIHHRVKNNLQIISSLLKAQSSYLDSPEAKTAIRDSQNRLQAISIVHHKLYQSDDMAMVDLKQYIEELARSICDSFQKGKPVQFDFKIAEISLATADTVPLGLILNEAITNSVKYAFSDGEPGLIMVSLSENGDGAYLLTIRDNGKGLPPDFDIHTCTSLGMKLMVGLTEQLSGTFDIRSDQGTVLTIVFYPTPSTTDQTHFA